MVSLQGYNQAVSDSIILIDVGDGDEPVEVSSVISDLKIDVTAISNNTYSKISTNSIINSLTGTYYTKLETYNKTQVDGFIGGLSSIDNVYTKAQIDNNIYTKVQSDNNYYNKLVTYTKLESNNLISSLNSTYYTKLETYNKTEVNNLIPSLSNIYTKTEIDNNIYTKVQSDNNYYNKLVTYTKTEVNNLIPSLSNIYTKTEIDNNIYTKVQTNSLLNGKVNLAGNNTLTGNFTVEGTANLNNGLTVSNGNVILAAGVSVSTLRVASSTLTIDCFPNVLNATIHMFDNVNVINRYSLLLNASNFDFEIRNKSNNSLLAIADSDGQFYFNRQVNLMGSSNLNVNGAGVFLGGLTVQGNSLSSGNQTVGGDVISSGDVRVNKDQPSLILQRAGVTKYSILVNPITENLQFRTGSINTLTLQSDGNAFFNNNLSLFGTGNLNCNGGGVFLGGLTVQNNAVVSGNHTVGGALTVAGADGLRINGNTGAQANNALLRFWNNTLNVVAYSMYWNSTNGDLEIGSASNKLIGIDDNAFTVYNNKITMNNDEPTLMLQRSSVNKYSIGVDTSDKFIIKDEINNYNLLTVDATNFYVSKNIMTNGDIRIDGGAGNNAELNFYNSGNNTTPYNISWDASTDALNVNRAGIGAALNINSSGNITAGFNLTVGGALRNTFHPNVVVSLNNASVNLSNNTADGVAIIFDSILSGPTQNHGPSNNLVYNTANNNGRFTCPTGMNGLWFFSAWFRVAASNTGRHIIWFRKNGTTDYLRTDGAYGASGSCIIDMVANDYVQVLAYQNTGGNSNYLIGNNTRCVCRFLG